MAVENQNSQANSVKTILVVEDEALIALNQKAILTKNGYQVITAYDGEKAVRAVSEAAIDLILMDIDLGKEKMDGTEAAEQILRQHQLPIVFLTSHSEQEMVEKVKGITRYGYVLKNAGEFVLLEAITMAFELFRSFLAIQEKERQLELAFKESEWKYQFLLKNLDDIIYTIDMVTEEFSFVSPAFERVLGYTLDDVEKMGGRKAFLSRVIQYGAFQEQLKALAEFAGGNAQRLRHISVWKAKDGTPKTLEDYWVPVYENGRIGTVHGVLRDLSDRKRAEDALRESEDKYKTLIDNIPFAVFELDGTGTLVTANKTFADFIGSPRDELAGRNMADLFPPEAIEVRKNYVEKAITEKTIQRFTDELNGRIFQHIIVPLSARGGGRVQIIARDVTDEVAAKQESEEHRLYNAGRADTPC